jgi:hypothetical protein
LPEWSFAADLGVIPTPTRTGMTLHIGSSALTFAALLACHHAAFPGPLAICRSPDSTHVLRLAEPGHHLLLSGHQQPDRELLAFPRHVEAFWSPAGRHLAVTNAWASDESTVLLWSDLTGGPEDLLEALAAQEGQSAARWNSHHLYLEAKGWRAEAELRLRLWGYGDPPHAIERRHVYTLGRGFTRE